ncbi:hypothetical protein A0H76_2738 [Hepatospora eriocheir]|uniref:Uncharacterized protein n=1 Tax=Hepatospora eriocheir TaxID=1081669 RepID=A0A1X0QEV4_9MICR|nr:hypothetical protein A0H76_2738 [Hepatospora eriocheir]
MEGIEYDDELKSILTKSNKKTSDTFYIKHFDKLIKPLIKENMSSLIELIKNIYKKYKINHFNLLLKLIDKNDKKTSLYVRIEKLLAEGKSVKDDKDNVITKDTLIKDLLTSLSLDNEEEDLIDTFIKHFNEHDNECLEYLFKLIEFRFDTKLFVLLIKLIPSKSFFGVSNDYNLPFYFYKYITINDLWCTIIKENMIINSYVIKYYLEYFYYYEFHSIHAVKIFKKIILYLETNNINKKYIHHILNSILRNKSKIIHKLILTLLKDVISLLLDDDLDNDLNKELNEFIENNKDFIIIDKDKLHKSIINEFKPDNEGYDRSKYIKHKDIANDENLIFKDTIRFACTDTKDIPMSLFKEDFNRIEKLKQFDRLCSIVMLNEFHKQQDNKEYSVNELIKTLILKSVSSKELVLSVLVNNWNKFDKEFITTTAMKIINEEDNTLDWRYKSLIIYNYEKLNLDKELVIETFKDDKIFYIRKLIENLK